MRESADYGVNRRSPERIYLPWNQSTAEEAAAENELEIRIGWMTEHIPVSNEPAQAAAKGRTSDGDQRQVRVLTDAPILLPILPAGTRVQ